MTVSLTLRLAASVLLLGLLAWRIDLSTLGAHLADIEPLWALAALALWDRAVPAGPALRVLALAALPALARHLRRGA